MKRIKDNVKSEIVIEKSRFITYLFKVDDETQVSSIIKDLNKTYSDATHVVHAYRIGIIERSTDNGEPKGTAGIPTLEVLRNNDLDHCLAVTIRYFGGIKLGASGVLRAYINSCTEAINIATFLKERETLTLKLTLNYSDASSFDSLYNKYISINKEYSDNVSYTIIIDKADYNNLNDFVSQFGNRYTLEIIKEEVMYL